MNKYHYYAAFLKHFNPNEMSGITISVKFCRQVLFEYSLLFLFFLIHILKYSYFPAASTNLKHKRRNVTMSGKNK